MLDIPNKKKGLLYSIIAFLILTITIETSILLFANTHVIYDTKNDEQVLKLMQPIWIFIESDDGQIKYSELKYYPNALLKHSLPPPNKDVEKNNTRIKKNTFLVEITRQNISHFSTNGGSPTEILQDIGFVNGVFQYDLFHNESFSSSLFLPIPVQIVMYDESQDIVSNFFSTSATFIGNKDQNNLNPDTLQNTPGDTLILRLVLNRNGTLNPDI